MIPLPMEIIADIASDLRTRELCSMARVSHSFQDEAEPFLYRSVLLFTDLDDRFIDFMSNMASHPRRSTFVRELSVPASIRFVSERPVSGRISAIQHLVHKGLKAVNNLVHLEIVEGMGYDTYFQVSMIKDCQFTLQKLALKSASLSTSTTMHIIAGQPDLEELRWSSDSDIPMKHRLSIILPRLHTAELDTIWHLSTLVAPQIARLSLRLTMVAYSLDADPIEVKFSEQLSRFRGSLRHLNLWSFTSDEVLLRCLEGFIAEPNTRLNSLTLRLGRAYDNPSLLSRLIELVSKCEALNMMIVTFGRTLPEERPLYYFVEYVKPFFRACPTLERFGTLDHNGIPVPWNESLAEEKVEVFRRGPDDELEYDGPGSLDVNSWRTLA